MMLNDILDLCIEKSDGRYFYEFKYSGTGKYVFISKIDTKDGFWVVWFRTFKLDDLESALELMENE